MWSDFGVPVYAVLHHTRALCKRRQTAFKGFDSPGELFPLIPSGVPQTALQVLDAPPYRLCSGKVLFPQGLHALFFHNK